MCKLLFEAEAKEMLTRPQRCHCRRLVAVSMVATPTKAMIVYAQALEPLTPVVGKD